MHTPLLSKEHLLLQLIPRETGPHPQEKKGKQETMFTLGQIVVLNV